MALTGEQALALSKKYTRETAEGMGAIKGEDGFSPIITENPDNTDTDYRLDVITAFASFTTENLKGTKGETGNGIVSVTKESSTGNADTYRIIFTDNTSTTFTVTNATTVENLSQLNNDTGFITNTVNNLINYYTKADTYSKDEISALLQNIGAGLSVMAVTALPTDNISATTIYLVKDNADSNSYEQWMYINNEWASLGSTTIDLSNYYTKPDMDNLLLGYVTTSALLTVLADYVKKSELATVATSGSYNDLKDLPTILSTDGFATIDYVDESIANSIIPITIDNVLSTESQNPVQNKVITKELDKVEQEFNETSLIKSAKGESLILSNTIDSPMILNDWDRTLFEQEQYTNGYDISTYSDNLSINPKNGTWLGEYNTALTDSYVFLPNRIYELSFIGVSGHKVYPNEDIFTTCETFECTGERQSVVYVTKSTIPTYSSVTIFKNGIGNTVRPNFTDFEIRLINTVHVKNDTEAPVVTRSYDGFTKIDSPGYVSAAYAINDTGKNLLKYTDPSILKSESVLSTVEQCEASTNVADVAGASAVAELSIKLSHPSVKYFYNSQFTFPSVVNLSYSGLRVNKNGFFYFYQLQLYVSGHATNKIYEITVDDSSVFDEIGLLCPLGHWAKNHNSTALINNPISITWQKDKIEFSLAETTTHVINAWAIGYKK